MSKETIEALLQAAIEVINTIDFTDQPAALEHAKIAVGFLDDAKRDLK